MQREQTYYFIGCFPFADTIRHKYRSVSVIYWMPRKIEQCLCRLVSLNGKHPLHLDTTCMYMPLTF